VPKDAFVLSGQKFCDSTHRMDATAGRVTMPMIVDISNYDFKTSPANKL
jgi:hypothetical protein